MHISPSFRIRCLRVAASAAAFMFVSAARDAAAQNYDAMWEQNMRQLEAMQAQTAQQAEQQLQIYMQQDRARLEPEYQQYIQSTGAQISYEQYVRAKVQNEAARRMNQQNGGTNPMFEQQKRMFEAGQQAHFQRQQQFENQNQNWAAGQQQIEMNNQAWANGQRQIESGHNRFIQQGIQGNQFYRNTETGEVAELPFAGDPGVYRNGNGGTWNSQGMGQFQQVGPNGMPQQMEAYEPPSYADDNW